MGRAGRSSPAQNVQTLTRTFRAASRWDRPDRRPRQARLVDRQVGARNTMRLDAGQLRRGDRSLANRAASARSFAGAWVYSAGSLLHAPGGGAPAPPAGPVPAPGGIRCEKPRPDILQHMGFEVRTSGFGKGSLRYRREEVARERPEALRGECFRLFDGEGAAVWKSHRCSSPGTTAFASACWLAPLGAWRDRQQSADSVEG